MLPWCRKEAAWRLRGGLSMVRAVPAALGVVLVLVSTSPTDHVVLQGALNVRGTSGARPSDVSPGIGGLSEQGELARRKREQALREQAERERQRREQFEQDQLARRRLAQGEAERDAEADRAGL